MSVNFNDQLDLIFTSSGILNVANNGGLVLPQGTTSQQPNASLNPGLIRYNTTTHVLEAAYGGVYHTFAFTDGITGFVQKSGDTMTGNLAVEPTIASGYALTVTQSGSAQAYFGSTGLNGSVISIDNATGNQQSGINFNDAGVNKWYLLKQTDNTFQLFDSTNSKYFLTASTGGNLVLGPQQTFNIDQSGNVGIGSLTTGYKLSVIQAGPQQAYFGSTGANTSLVVIDNQSGSNNSQLTLQSAGASKFSLINNAAAFSLYDEVGHQTLIGATSGGNIVVGAGISGNLTVDPSGNVYVATQSNGDNSTRAASTAFVHNYVTAVSAPLPATAHAWGSVYGSGAFRSSYGVSTGFKYGTGSWQIDFITPTANANYAVFILITDANESNPNTQNDQWPTVYNGLKTTAGFQVQTSAHQNGRTNSNFDFVVFTY